MQGARIGISRRSTNVATLPSASDSRPRGLMTRAAWVSAHMCDGVHTAARCRALASGSAVAAPMLRPCRLRRIAALAA